MDVNALSGNSTAAAGPRSSVQAEQVEKNRNSQLDQAAAGEDNEKKVQPEELVNQIKKLTEDGLYSVRFETDKRTDDMVVKIVDRESDEVIRQVPPEELLDLMDRLADMRGNIVDEVA